MTVYRPTTGNDCLALLETGYIYIYMTILIFKNNMNTNGYTTKLSYTLFNGTLGSRGAYVSKARRNELIIII